MADLQYWENHYQQNVTGWDLKQAAPPFFSLLDSPTTPTPGKIAALGAGSGYYALLFAQRDICRNLWNSAVNGNNKVQWVKVIVNPLSREVLSYQGQIVPGNRYE